MLLTHGGRERTNARNTRRSGRPGSSSTAGGSYTLSSFKRMLGEALRAVKPEYITIEIATKIAAYNKTRNVMREAVW